MPIVSMFYMIKIVNTRQDYLPCNKSKKRFFFIVENDAIIVV